ncbi:MAG: hypothetical protein QM581_08795 [Pseudomonas sp.]
MKYMQNFQDFRLMTMRVPDMPQAHVGDCSGVDPARIAPAGWA